MCMNKMLERFHEDLISPLFYRQKDFHLVLFSFFFLTKHNQFVRTLTCLVLTQIKYHPHIIEVANKYSRKKHQFIENDFTSSSL